MLWQKPIIIKQQEHKRRISWNSHFIYGTQNEKAEKNRITEK